MELFQLCLEIVLLQSLMIFYSKQYYGSGCGSVGRVVTSKTRSPQFKSSHQQNLYSTFVFCQLYWKDENKEESGREWITAQNLSET